MQKTIILKEITAFLSSTTGQSLAPDCDLIERGVIDSLTMMDLLTFVETTFDVPLDYDDLTPETLGTIEAITNLIVSRMPQSGDSLAA